MESFTGDMVPPLLTVCADRESKQWAALNFVRFGLGLNVEALPDYFHMSWNDLLNSMATIGMLHHLHRAVAIHNCAYGPWQKGAFFQEMADGGKELKAHLSPDDPLLTRLWAQICHDHGWTSETETDADARARFLADFTALPVCSVKGKKASMSRFYSVLDSASFWDKEWHSKLLLLVFMGFRRGWISHSEDVWPGQATHAHHASLLWRVHPASGSSRTRLQEGHVHALYVCLWGCLFWRCLG